MPVTSPINVQVLEYFLSGYDDTEKQYLLEGFRYGFSLNYGGDQIGGIFKNHPSVLNNEEIVSNKLIQELQLDRIAGPFDDPPFHDFRSSPLGLVPKKEPGEFRVIHDLSYPKHSQGVSINSNISPENSTVSYDDLDYAISIIQQYGQACLVSKTDIESAFRIIPIQPNDYKLLGFSWKGKYYFDKCLPMGCSSSCRIFEAFSTALQWIATVKLHVSPMSHILDDFMFFGPPNSSQCATDLDKFMSLCKQLNVPIKQSKTVLPTTKIILHGIHVDTIQLTISLPQDKNTALTTLISDIYRRKSIPLTMLQSVIGSMNFACKVIVPGRAFSRRLIDLTKGVSKPHHHVRLNKESRADLKAWLTFLAEFNGQYIFINQRWLSSDKIKLYTDSAGSLGYAAVYGSSWVNGSWPTSWHKFNITLLELYPIMLALELWGSQLANHAVLFLCDNEAVVHIINKQSSKEPNIMVLVRRLVLSALKFNILFKAKHIPGKHNNIADRLSRFQVNEARRLAPWLAKNPVVPPHHLFPSNIL